MLPKLHRLPSRDIPIVMRSGVRYQSAHLTCIVLSAAPQTNSRFAIVVSAKVDKRATVRNRIKRMMSEYIRRNLSDIKTGVSVVCIVKKILDSTVGSDTDRLMSDMFRVAHVLGRI